MLTSEERREVAAKLRECAEDDNGIIATIDRGLYSEMLLRAVRACIGNGDMFERLADLIDRPTCNMDMTDTYETADGLKIRTWECDRCGHTCEEVNGSYEFCPHCGTEVVA